MKIEQSKEESKLVLNIEGRVDTATSPILQTVLLDAYKEHDHIIIDLKQVNYVSSAGLRVFLMAHKAAVGKGGSLFLRHVSDEIMEILQITGFTSFLKIEP